MSLRIVRLGEPRLPDEGLRIGTVRRPPRGVPKARHASDDWYDIWYPLLSPTAELVSLARNARTSKDWARFVQQFTAQMRSPEAAQTLDLLAALSHGSNFSVGCYCEDEMRCHRSVLRELLARRGALIRDAGS